MNIFQKITLIWQKINLIQRTLLIAVALTSVVIGIFLVQWAQRPDMRVLYQGLSPAEASKITEKIGEKNIAYKLLDGGTTIYVPQEAVYQLRLDMAKEGLPADQQSGYKIFDDEKIGISPFVQDVNLKRALQDELAKSIQMIEGVLYARVHIVSPERRLFASESGKTTASVVLRLRPGYEVSGHNIAAITHMVAGSVEELESENVTVIDSQGRLLSSESDQALAGGASTVQDYKERVEQNLAKKAEDMLTSVLGPGRASVAVSAIIDMNSVNTVVESYDRAAQVPKKEEITTKSEIEQNGNSQGGTAAGPSSTKKDQTIVTEYEVGKTVKQEVILPGVIKSLSVAAFVDLSATDANDTTAGEAAVIMQISDVEEIIRNSLGLKETDLLKVVDARFNQPQELFVEEEPANWNRYIAIARHASLGVMAVCALLVLRIFSKAKKKTESSVAAQIAVSELQAESSAGMLPAGQPATGASESLLLRRQIAGALQSNPDQVRQLFASWIEEKE